MTTFSKQIKVKASKQNVWDAMANLGGIYKFNPAVSKSYYTSHHEKGIGASRICELRPSGKVEEIARQWEEGTSYTLEIIPLEKAPPIKKFFVDLTVSAVNNELTQVTVTMNYETKLGVIGKLLDSLIIKSQMEKAITQLLDGLKLNMEKGYEIHDVNTLKRLLQAA